MRLAVLSLAAFALTSCVGTPAIERVAAEVESSGVCKSLPEGVTCDCVISSAHSAIPTITAPRSKDDTGSRLGRGTIGAADPRVGIAIAQAKQSCAAGKAVG